MLKSRSFILNALIVLLSVALFVPFIGGVHLFDWDEINFAESAREMIVSGDYLNVKINFVPFWEKPPLFIWMQVLSMKMFGINEFAARFPDTICGIMTLLLVFNIGRKLYSEKFGLIWVMSFAFSILPFLYFKSGIIDPWFNLFIFLGIYLFIRYTHKKRAIFILLSAASIGLGILTKGPVALLVFLLTVGFYWIFNHFRLKLRFSDALIFTITLVIVGGFWFILQLASGNKTVIADFINYQIRLFRTEDAGHGGFLLYHFVILLIGVFPASVFAVAGFSKFRSDLPEQRNFKKWMLVLFWVVLILFTIVRTKIVHYSSLCYFPLTFLAALAIYHYITKKIVPPWWIVVGILTTGFLIAVSVTALPFLENFKEHIAGSSLVRDNFTREIVLAKVPWHGYEFVSGLLLIAGLIVYIVFQIRQKTTAAITLLFTITGLSVYMTLLTYTSKIEHYSQRAAIDFFRSLSGRDVYVETLGYKSYADLFYAKKETPDNPESYNSNWLLTGNIDKDAYFSCKITSKDEILKKYPGLRLLYEKNGYVFLYRPKGETNDENPQNSKKN